MPGAMVTAYRSASGDLAARLLAALDAAEGEGGDLRGRQSAALLVVAGRGAARAPFTDLRVDDHEQPLNDLRRLLELRRAYARVESGDELAASGDVAGSLHEYAAAHAAQPANAELGFWRGAALAASGREDEALGLIRAAIDAHGGWAGLLRRLPAAGLFPDDPALIDRLVGSRSAAP